MPKPLKYEFVIFTLKDHSTWRMCDKEAFARDIKSENVTATKSIVIDRLTGEVTVEE